MNTFTAIYENKWLTLIDDATSQEVGKISYQQPLDIYISINEDKFQLSPEKRKIKIFKNYKKIDTLVKYNFLGNYKSKKSKFRIKGISSWKGGTKLVDKNDNLLLSVTNENGLTNNGKYKIQTHQDEVDPYCILLSLHLHLKASKSNMLVPMITAILSVTLLRNFFY